MAIETQINIAPLKKILQIQSKFDGEWFPFHKTF